MNRYIDKYSIRNSFELKILQKKDCFDDMHCLFWMESFQKTNQWDIIHEFNVMNDSENYYFLVGCNEFAYFLT